MRGHVNYASGGVALRSATGPSGERLTYRPEDYEPDEDGVVDPQAQTSSLDVELAKSSVSGAVVSLGFEAADDFNVKFNLEVRYTRWFDNPIDVGFARSNPSQLDIVVGLTF